MKSILEQMYNGEMFPYGKFNAIVDEYKEDKTKAIQNYALYIEKLPENLRDEFEQVVDSYFDLLPLEMEKNFIIGFSIGARLMIEAFYTIPE